MYLLGMLCLVLGYGLWIVALLILGMIVLREIEGRVGGWLFAAMVVGFGAAWSTAASTMLFRKRAKVVGDDDPAT